MVSHWKKEARSKRYIAETNTDADYTVYLPVSTPAQAEFLLHSLEQAAGGIGLYVNANKTDFMC